VYRIPVPQRLWEYRIGAKVFANTKEYQSLPTLWNAKPLSIKDTRAHPVTTRLKGLED